MLEQKLISLPQDYAPAMASMSMSDLDDRERDQEHGGNGDGDDNGNGNGSGNTNIDTNTNTNVNGDNLKIDALDRDPDLDLAVSVAGDSVAGNLSAATNPRKRKKSSRASVPVIRLFSSPLANCLGTRQQVSVAAEHGSAALHTPAMPLTSNASILTCFQMRLLPCQSPAL